MALRLGFVGYGYWGPNLVRNFACTEDCVVAAICDSDDQHLRRASGCYQSARLTGNYDDLLNDSSIDAIVIATPLRFHFEFAMAALQRGKHVLVEKPITCSVEEAARLAEEASRRSLVLLVDHTFLFTPAVRKLQQIVEAGVLGDLHHFDSIRANLGIFRDDVNVFWDLAVHDLTILQHVLPEQPAALSAIGVHDVHGYPQSIGYLTLFFDSGLIAHITASWLSPRKIRQVVIGGSQRMLCFDDVEPCEKVKLFNKCSVSQNAVDMSELGAGFQRDDIWVPCLEQKEALLSLAHHFRDCIQGAATPLCDARSGQRTIELLTAVDRSAAEGGRRIDLR